uniref:DNM1B n=1 Tax=Arundo donax TaxID=35708 RepID=A0A0A9HY54_ARUDO
MKDEINQFPARWWIFWSKICQIDSIYFLVLHPIFLDHDNRGFLRQAYGFLFEIRTGCCSPQSLAGNMSTTIFNSMMRLFCCILRSILQFAVFSGFLPLLLRLCSAPFCSCGNRRSRTFHHVSQVD